MTQVSTSPNPEEDRLAGHLAAMPDGASAPVLSRLLGISQPTLSRMLGRMQGRGLVLAEGKARSRRYHWVGGRPGLAALRRRRLHEMVAHKLVDQPGLIGALWSGAQWPLSIIGLTIARELVELLGGEISVSSKVGEGSMFTILLPRREPPGSA